MIIEQNRYLISTENIFSENIFSKGEESVDFSFFLYSLKKDIKK